MKTKQKITTVTARPVEKRPANVHLNAADLKLQTEQLMRHTLATASLKTYEVGVRAWLRFCQQYNFLPLNPLSGQVCSFVTWLSLPSPSSKNGLQAKTIKVYLNGLRHIHVANSLESPIASLQVWMLLRAVKRTQAKVETVPRRPVTVSLLSYLRPLLNLNSYDDSVFWLIMVFGVRGLFRLGELLPSSKHDIDHNVLTTDNVTSLPDRTSVFLAASKTDPFRLGVVVPMFTTGDAVCPSAAYASVLIKRKAANIAARAPLFCNLSGNILVKSDIIFTMDSVFNYVNQSLGLPSLLGSYKGHSLRRGGATSLALSGVPDRVIQIVGRWKSDSYKLYIESNTDELKSAHQKASLIRRSDLFVGLGTGRPSGWKNEEKDEQ